MIDHQRLRELAQAATPGPWTALTARDGDEDGYCNTEYITGEVAAPDGNPDSDFEVTPMFETLPADAEFIAEANPATVLALLDEIAALKASTSVSDNVPCTSCNWAPDEYWAAP